MKLLFFVALALSCILFAKPFGQSAAKFQSKLIGVELRPSIFVWSYRLAGSALLIIVFALFFIGRY